MEVVPVYSMIVTIIKVLAIIAAKGISVSTKINHSSNSGPRPSFYPLYTLNRDHIPVFKGDREGPGK